MAKVILIAQRGWVFVGDDVSTTDEVKLKNAFCIRRWGTTNGLGQLALEGPQPETILDPIGEFSTHPLAVIGRIKCNEDVWKN